MTDHIRNVAIVAHVDHGKTTLVDRLLQQAGGLDGRTPLRERLLDSNELERERGITILSKSTTLHWRGCRINVVDTPGHADFGGEVERILSMVDGVLLLVDAVDGPMPQTRFVTRKAFARGLVPIVVINKIDRDGARPQWVLDRTFDLFDRLGASEAQLDFPVLYASALAGYASASPQARSGDMGALLDAILEHVPPPAVDADGPLQLQITSLDHSTYVGTVGIGRVSRGRLRRNAAVTVIDRGGMRRGARVLQVLGFAGLARVEREEAAAGDIVAITGIEGLRVSDTLCDPAVPQALPPLAIDEPTVQMELRVNDSPFAGREGRFLTSRQIRERLERELERSVALRVAPTTDVGFLISGRGELQLAILIETMRREGFELAVGRPQPVLERRDGALWEPFELLAVDVDVAYQGAVMERVAARGGELEMLHGDGRGRMHLEYRIPARGLIGLRRELAGVTAGTAVMHHSFDAYGPLRPGGGGRGHGVLIANGGGRAVAYALFNLQQRGRLLIEPGQDVYEGMIVGLHTRANDLVVNPTRGKQLTNVRAAMNDENVLLTPALRLDLEQALELIDDDELVEVTPRALRLRKRLLHEHARRRAARAAAG